MITDIFFELSFIGETAIGNGDNLIVGFSFSPDFDLYLPKMTHIGRNKLIANV